MATQAEITEIYRQVLGREPDPAGLQYWTEQLANKDIGTSINYITGGATGTDVAKAQAYTAAPTQLTGLLTTPTTTTTTASTTPSYDVSKTVEFRNAGAGGQYGYVNGFPVLKASIADQVLAANNGYVSGDAAGTTDNAMGWDTGSVQGTLANGAGVFGVKKEQQTDTEGQPTGQVNYSGDMDAAAKALNLDVAGMTDDQKYAAINNAAKDLYLVSGKTGYQAGGIGNEYNGRVQTAAIPGATTNHATVLYRKQGDALVPITETAQYFNGEMELSPGSGLSSFLSFAAPIAGLALMATPGAQGLGASLLTGMGVAAPTAAASLAATGALVGAGTAAATGGNVLTGAALGGLGGYAQAGGLSGVTNTLGNAFADITGLDLSTVMDTFQGANTSGGLVNQVFDDGSVLVTNSAGQIVGGMDAAGQAFGNITAQVFDDGSRLLTGANGQVIGGVDTSGSFFNGTNSISTAGSTGVQTGGANQYAGSGANLGGTPVTNFGGNLATPSQVSNLMTGTGAATAGTSTIADTLKNLITPSTVSGLLGSVVGTKQAQADKADRDAQAAAIERAAANAAAMQQFQPIGMTTRFGSTTTPKYDANGRLIGYGYTPAADIAAQRDKLLTLSGQALPTTTNLTQATTDYYNQLQALQQPGREQELASIQSRLQATGRGGLAFGATTGTGGANALAATNPELAAYYNALAQTQAQQALTAQDVAQQRLNQQIATSGNLFTQAGALETAAQQPMNIGLNIGQTATAGSTTAANTLYDAALRAAQARLTGNLDLNRAQAAGLAGATTAAGGLLSTAANAGINYLSNLV